MTGTRYMEIITECTTTNSIVTFDSATYNHNSLYGTIHELKVSTSSFVISDLTPYFAHNSRHIHNACTCEIICSFLMFIIPLRFLS
jgi:hypothetical protein